MIEKKTAPEKSPEISFDSDHVFGVSSAGSRLDRFLENYPCSADAGNTKITTKNNKAKSNKTNRKARSKTK